MTNELDTRGIRSIMLWMELRPPKPLKRTLIEKGAFREFD